MDSNGYKRQDILEELERLIEQKQHRDPNHSKAYSTRFRTLIIKALELGVNEKELVLKTGILKETLNRWTRENRETIQKTAFKSLNVIGNQEALVGAQQSTQQSDVNQSIRIILKNKIVIEVGSLNLDILKQLSMLEV